MTFSKWTIGQLLVKEKNRCVAGAEREHLEKDKAEGSFLKGDERGADERREEGLEGGSRNCAHQMDTKEIEKEHR